MSDLPPEDEGALGESSRLTVSEPDVVAKVIDGEAIIINLSTGTYYSLNGAGSMIWELLSHGFSIGEIAEAVAIRYSVPAPQASIDTLALSEHLVGEGLARLDPSLVGPRLERAPTESGADPYTTPSLEVFTDMSELLALDPPMPGAATTTWSDAGDDA